MQRFKETGNVSQTAWGFVVYIGDQAWKIQLMAFGEDSGPPKPLLTNPNGQNVTRSKKEGKQIEFWQVHRCQKLKGQWELSTWKPCRDRIIMTWQETESFFLCLSFAFAVENPSYRCLSQTKFRGLQMYPSLTGKWKEQVDVTPHAR